MSCRQYWDKVFEDEWKTYYENSNTEMQDYWYDNWLDKYENILNNSKEIPIIDLGCGFGVISRYLINNGYKVIACDFSSEALMHLKKIIPEAVVSEFDMLNGLPFEENSIKIVVADLSIHYFYWEDTIKVVNNIAKVLEEGGYFIFRVNSINDENYSQGKNAQKIEDGYFKFKDNAIRLFNEEQLKQLFKGWNIINIQENDIVRYRRTKTVWEVVVCKKKNAYSD